MQHLGLSQERPQGAGPFAATDKCAFLCFPAHFTTVQAQEKGFPLHELLLPSLICFTHKACISGPYYYCFHVNYKHSS